MTDPTTNQTSDNNEEKRTALDYIRAESKAYNGWTNYETWAVKLWIDNEEGTYNYWRERAQETWDDAQGNQYTTRERMFVRNLADTLKDEHNENAPTANDASVYTDLLNAALSEVNWYEIAETYLEDIDRSDEDEESEDDNE